VSASPLYANNKVPQNLEDFKLVNRPPRGLVGENLTRHVFCECDALIDLSTKLWLPDYTHV